MAIGRTFEESLQKALRMTDPSVGGFEPCGFDDASVSDSELAKLLEVASDRRVYAISLAMQRAWSVDKIWGMTRIDRWFLYKLQRAWRCPQFLEPLGHGRSVFAHRKRRAHPAFAGISNMQRILSEYSPATLPAMSLLQAKEASFFFLSLSLLLL